MRLKLNDPSCEPVCGYIYVDPDTHYTVNSRSLPGLVSAAAQHRAANGLAVPEDFADQVEHQLCNRLPDDSCYAVGGVRDTSCIHRGDHIRFVQCSTCCGGGVRAKVIACAVHGEATQFSKELSDTNLHYCWKCPDRVSALTVTQE